MATSANQLAKSGKFGDLRRRLVFLVLALVVYRLGAHIPVPGIDPAQLQQLFKGQAGGILSLFNMFSGGALSRFTVFALGIMPYISASIIMQLMTYVVPTLEALKKAGLVPGGALRAKIILTGKVEKKFAVSGIGASKGAKDAIEKAGGSVAALVVAEPVKKLAKKAKPAAAE